MIPITSLQNESVKRCVTLREARRRLAQRRFLIDGVRELRRAIESNVRIVEVFVCPSLCKNPESIAFLDVWLPRLEAERKIRQELRLYEVTEPVFAKLAFGDRTEGFVAVAETPDTSLAMLTRRLCIAAQTTGIGDANRPETVPKRTEVHDGERSKPDKLGQSAQPLLLGIAENVEKPGNLGAVLRSADGAGVTGVIACDSRRTEADLFHSATIRASLGTIFHLPVTTALTSEAISWLRDTAHVRIFAARVEGAIPYSQVDFTGPSAIVVGSESNGLSSAW